MTEGWWVRLGLGERSHAQALRWLGLLFRKPRRLRERLAEAPVRKQLAVGSLLLLHGLPWVFLTALMGRIAIFEIPSLGGPTHTGLVGLGAVVNEVAPKTALGILGGGAVGSAFGLTRRITDGISQGIAAGIVSALACGIAIGIALGIAPGATLGLPQTTQGGIALAVALGIVTGVVAETDIGFVEGIVLGAAYGLVAGIAGGIAYGIAATRAFYLPVHGLLMWIRPLPDLIKLHPVAWDDLIGVPLRGLHGLLVEFAVAEPDEGPERIDRLIDSCPPQRFEALKAKTILLIRRAAAVPLAHLDEAMEGLPEGDRGFLSHTPTTRTVMTGFAEHQRRIDTIDRAFLLESETRALLQEFETFRQRVGGLPAPLGCELQAAATHWLEAARRQHEAARRLVEGVPAPRVFRVGAPVRRRSQAFVQRRGVMGELERQITQTTGRPGMVLYGRRCTGKSTLLANLDGFLPDGFGVVSLSMRSARTNASLEGFLDVVHEELGAAVPGLDGEAPEDLAELEGLLDSVDEHLEFRKTVLIVGLDDYDELDPRFREGTFPVALLGSFRESIQRHRNLIWLFAGSHEITELRHAPWTSYLVSVRTVEVPPFREEETRLLLTDPMRHSRLYRDEDQRPSFEPGFWGEGGIERVHGEAGGWPHLVQLVAESLVDRVNGSGAGGVTPALFERALDRAVVAGDIVFHQLLRGECTVDGEWDYLAGFAGSDEQEAPTDPAVAARLRRRQLVVEDGDRWRLRAPLMGRWLRLRRT